MEEAILSHISHLNDLEDSANTTRELAIATDIEALCTQLPSMYKIILIDVENNQLTPESIKLIINSLLANVPLRKISYVIQPTFFRVSVKPGLWTGLDYGLDWTLDWTGLWTGLD